MHQFFTVKVDNGWLWLIEDLVVVERSEILSTVSVRDISCAVFKSLQSALGASGLEEFNEPNFTSLKSVTNLFTIIIGYNEIEVKKFCSRCLKSRGKAELIVNQVKDFAFIYKYSKRHLMISFNFLSFEC